MQKQKVFLYTSILILYSIFFILTSPIHAATSTDSADVDPDTIKENIKKRIEQVIKNQADESKKRIAYLGTISSVTTNSFSLNAANGDTQQASTSATTVVVELPTNKEITLADLSIGDYIAALGYLYDNTEVLDTRRILIQRIKPEPSTKKSIVGVITDINLRLNTITVRGLISGQESSFKISTKAVIQLADKFFTKTKISAKDILIQSTCLIIYEPTDSAAATPLATSLLIKSIDESSAPSASPSGTLTPKDL